MSEPTAARELTADEATFAVSAERFGFATTDELEPLREIIGQPRALRALELGLGVRHRQHHIYVAGMTGTGRMELVRRELESRMQSAAIPSDWLYVNNFDEPDRPVAIALPAGQGAQLKHDVDHLLETLVDAIPKAFREEDFGREKERLRQQYRQRGEKVFGELEQLANENSMTVQQMPDGQLLFIPLKDGKPMTPEEVQELTPEQIEELEKNQEKLIEKAGNVLTEQQEIERQLTFDVRQVAREFAQRLVEPLIAQIAARYESAKLREWLEKLEGHIVDHLERFREHGSQPANILAALREEQAEGGDRLIEYRVNLVVDNGKLERPPVIIEDTPNYKNLFGTVERVVDRFGRVTTNFTRIKSGSLHRANGGYLVMNLMDALSEPFVWKELKRTLKSGSLKIEVYDPFAMFTVSALQPDPIPLTARIVALGEPLIYHLLYLYDEDFREIFRVKADFDDEMPRDEQAGRVYGRVVRELSASEGLLAFDAEGVGELVREGGRMVQNREKISTQFNRVADLVREADYWARREESGVVSGRHVQQAVRERIQRSSLVADKIRELIAEGTLLVTLTESAVGQVNGLAVADLGDYAFGRPSRVTASVGVGAGGVINIERESRLSGRTYDKAMLILEGYLRGTYSRQQPLSLSASIAMEQSYGGIDGDSASVAELLCLLSAVAEVPLRQDVAVTGSVNQRGEVQAIGGANEKIEGFYEVCRQAGLTGSQGVCIPAANVRNLVLRPDVVDEVRGGRFHIWAIERFDQAIALLTGIDPGGIDVENSFHQRVYRRLGEMAKILKGQPTTAGERVIWVPGTTPATPPDPRPPLPGEG